jgi:hypothetical protein
MPHRNEKDLDDVPEKIRKEMTFIFAESVDDVLNAALDPAPVKAGSNGHTSADLPAERAEEKAPEPEPMPA